MRADEFLVEAGLENSQLRKHSGKYLQVLINKIKAGDPLEIVPDKQARFGDKVIVDASAADDLLMAYFGTKEFPDMDKMDLAANGDIIPKSDPNKVMLKTQSGD